MYLRGSKWNMTRRRGRRVNIWRILLLLSLIGGLVYINQVVIPTTPPLFLPTPTQTREPESYINTANQLLESGKFAQAIAAYQEALQVNPDNPSIYIALARAQIYTNQYEDALNSAERALVLNSNNPLAHALKAWALDFKGDYTQAEASITNALELDQNSAVAHAIYAEILMDKTLAGQGDINGIDRAAEESRTAISLDPQSLEALRSRGYILWNTGNYAEAITEYKQALAVNDKIADLHLALGYNYRFLEEYDQAVQSYLQAFALNPTDPTAPYEISRTYATVGDFSQSVQYADQAVRIDPANARLHGNLGVMYYKNQQFDQSVEQLSLAIQGGTLEDGTIVTGLPLNYGTVAEYYAIYGLVLAKLNRCAEAVPIFQAIRSGVQDDEINVYNAEQGLAMCESNLTGEATGTPGEPGVEATQTPTS